MAVPEAIRVGPFTGGLNTASDPSAVQDTDIVICENFELDMDGALTNRPPIVDYGADFPLPANGRMQLLGFFSETSDTHYLLASDGVDSTYYLTGTSWQKITDELSATAFTQYKDKAWLIAGPNTSQEGGSWSPSQPFAAVPGMPRGQTIVSNKERLWIGPGVDAQADGAQLWYSAVGEPNKWPNTSDTGGGYLNVNGGDGQNIIELVIYFTDVLIFKADSVYRFSYNTDPGLGSLTRLSSTVGIADKQCVAAYESDLYILYKQHVYLLSNYNFSKMNVKVPMRADQPTSAVISPFHMSVWADRLMVGYLGETFSYHLRTKTWSKWKSKRMQHIGRFMEVPIRRGQERQAFVQSNALDSARLYFSSTEISDNAEDMDCIMRTKNYDYQSSHTFKKLAQWGADVIASDKVTAKANPIVYNVTNSWAEVGHKKWEDLGTWGNLLGSSIEVVDPVEIGGAAQDRKFIRFLKTMRFRQIYFEIIFKTDGSYRSAPAKLFSLTTFVGSKQTVPKKIN